MPEHVIHRQGDYGGLRFVGFFHPSRFRGREFKAYSTLVISSSGTEAKSVPAQAKLP